MEQRINPQAIARELLSNFDKQKPLSRDEAAMTKFALQKSGVPDAANRLFAGYMRLILNQIT